MPQTLSRGLIAAAFAVVALAAGCGGSDSSSSDSSSTEDWANGVCTAITTWSDSLKAAASSLQAGNLSKDALESTATEMKDSTSTFATDLKALGKPDTDAGDQAKEELDGLADAMSTDVDQIQSALDDASGASGALDAVSAVSGTLQKMGQQVSSTFAELGKLDASGELEQAFKDADSCSELRDSGSS